MTSHMNCMKDTLIHYGKFGLHAEQVQVPFCYHWYIHRRYAIHQLQLAHIVEIQSRSSISPIPKQHPLLGDFHPGSVA
jgi:hypothetical protein